MKKVLLIFMSLAGAASASNAQANPVNCDMLVSRDILVTGSAHRQLFQMLKEKGYNAVSDSNYHTGQEDQILAAGNYLYIQIHYTNEFGTSPDNMGVSLDINPGTNTGTTQINSFYDTPIKNDDSGNNSKILAMVAKITSCQL